MFHVMHILMVHTLVYINQGVKARQLYLIVYVTSGLADNPQHVFRTVSDCEYGSIVVSPL